MSIPALILGGVSCTVAGWLLGRWTAYRHKTMVERIVRQAVTAVLDTPFEEIGGVRHYGWGGDDHPTTVKVTDSSVTSPSLPPPTT